jgi:hypothetical protein
MIRSRTWSSAFTPARTTASASRSHVPRTAGSSSVTGQAAHQLGVGSESRRGEQPGQPDQGPRLPSLARQLLQPHRAARGRDEDAESCALGQTPSPTTTPATRASRARPRPTAGSRPRAATCACRRRRGARRAGAAERKRHRTARSAPARGLPAPRRRGSAGFVAARRGSSPPARSTRLRAAS